MQTHDILAKFLTHFEGPQKVKELRPALFVGGKETQAEKKMWQAATRIEVLGETGSPGAATSNISYSIARVLAVATPGRFLHFLREQHDQHSSTTNVKLFAKDLEVLVFDEADRLLEMGFEKDIREIVSFLPRQRRTGLFSATLQNSELHTLVKLGFAGRNPVQVKVEINQQQDHTEQLEILPERLENQFVEVPFQQKLPLLYHLLQKECRQQKTIIFFLTCAAVDFYHKALLHLGVRGVEKIHGQMDQKAREKNWKAFKESTISTPGGGSCETAAGTGSGSTAASSSAKSNKKKNSKKNQQQNKKNQEQCRVLLATDVVARGVDVPDVDLIIQFDPPCDPAAFIHRIGRTARAGAGGRSLLFLMPHETAYVDFLRNRDVKLRDLGHELVGKIRKQENGTTCTTARVDKRNEKEDARKERVNLLEQGDSRLPLEVALQDSNISQPVLEKMKKLTETDRAAMLKASACFVSFIRAYQEHQLRFLFQLEDLPLGNVATGMALLRLPRMREILGKKILNFTQSTVKPDDVPFLDKTREKQRQLKLEKQKQEALISREERAAEERAKKKEEEKKKKANDKVRTRTEKRQAGRRTRLAEWKALQMEECLAKKLKKGKISQKEFNREVKKIRAMEEDGDENSDMGSDSDDDSDSDSSDDDAGDSSDDEEVAAGKNKKKQAGDSNSATAQSAKKAGGKKDADDSSDEDEDAESHVAGSDSEAAAPSKKRSRSDDMSEDNDSDASLGISDEDSEDSEKAKPLKKRKKRVVKKKNRKR
ncbi:unnamed protein product [Amoebophrya sp. A25]|nr:unnamed protein product [Amoebophrya sp. A25]|eukprot:GSA25T00025531001.1